MKPVSIACDGLEEALEIIRYEMIARLCVDDGGYYVEVW